jgi:tetratricopeptide (TPR) repeat protein
MNANSVSSRIQLALLLLFLQSGIFAQNPNERVQSITAALSAGEFREALQSAQSGLQISPNNAQLWMLQGLAYSGTGDPKSALASYQHALKISPDYLPALEGAAQIEYDAGSQDAIPLLEHVLKMRPNDVTSHAMIAILAEKNGDCTTAVNHYSKSGPMLNSQPAALQSYGVCLLELKENDQAIQVFQQLMTSQPSNARCRRALAAVQLAAAVYEANKDTPSAVQILRDAIVKDPLQTALYADFAELAMDHQSFQTGVQMIDAGLKLQPGAAQLYVARGVLYVQLAEYDKAEADFEKAEELDPKEGMSAAAQGMLAEEQNQSDPQRALATVRAKLVKQPQEAFLWYLQAAILSQNSAEPGSAEFQQGLDSAKRAVTLQPSLTAAHNVLAKYYLAAGQNELAVKECRIVLEESPSDQSALYHLVMALRKTDKQAEIPDLLRRLAEARQEGTRLEGERNRYKLVVSSSEPTK